ncbi:MAG: exodeoxyribonuclease VII small subunit [Pseudomonadota bacterium]|nr:exodeoxyribonuclease VII small subunit [Pseudomonadota bacterium]MEC8245093.1 exodeoxyribonuclease VII small subunit [Pseudomonadota bacterium]
MNDSQGQQAGDLAKISFEDALRELEGIVASLERGDVSLDDAIAAFERGTALKAHCQARLEEARMKVEQIRLPADGTPPSEAAPFSTDS